jgi:transposase
MKAYSLDLRERVASTCCQAGNTAAQVAARFNVLASFVRKVRQRERLTGSVAALAHWSEPAPVLGPGD